MQKEDYARNYKSTFKPIFCKYSGQSILPFKSLCRKVTSNMSFKVFNDLKPAELEISLKLRLTKISFLCIKTKKTSLILFKSN